ncbi:MAG: DUF4878 domain-containing protein [Bacteroidales bacterium]|nr:DUF4878 domain-containing protein [Bacteroidales bacterium]
MKKIAILSLCALLALCGCTSKADKAGAAASNFLEAFFAMDYDAAAAFCSDEIATLVRDTLEASQYPSEEIRAKVVEASKNTTFKIVSSEADEETGEVTVKYEIYPYGAPKGAAIPRTMRLGKTGGDWKVVALE